MPPLTQFDLREKALELHVRTPEKIIYDGEAAAVSSVNEGGPFDVLPAHQNFITLIKEKLSIIDLQKQTHEVSVQSGVMKVRENIVDIFLGVEALHE